MRSALLLVAAGTLVASHPGTDPCLRLLRAGTQIQGDVRVCPGRYRIADPDGRGVIVIAASFTRLDLSGVTLESGDSTASRFVGVGIASRNVDQVEITGGTVRGYRYGVRIEGGRGHRIARMDLSGSRRQALRSTPESFDEADWLDIFHPDTFELYGGGLYLKWTDGVTVTDIVARDAQNGIGLFASRGAYLARNDVSNNSGWGIHLWQSSANVIVHNQAHHNVRCESPAYSRGCDSAGILLRQSSDSNLIADNDLSYSGDGFFLSGHRPLVRPSIGNIVVRNNAAGAYHNAFESTFSAWNTFLDNRADSAAYGFWLGYSTGNVVRGNIILDTRQSAIAIEHGSDNEIAGNVMIGGRTGVQLFAPHPGDDASRGYRIQDNTFARLDRAIVLQHTTQASIRGNLFDGVGVGIEADGAAADAQVVGNIFLRADSLYIRAPMLSAGDNYWSTPDSATTRQRIEGAVSLTPWQPASKVGY
ncbi:MAG: nitrous oxide reductase family maturation protein NosD [Gemmatimonadales bacterium]